MDKKLPSLKPTPMTKEKTKMTDAQKYEFSEKEIKAESLIVPDGENDWVIGSETFTRNEVLKILYTQRAMILNDLKQNCWDRLPVDAKQILYSPRKPKI